MKFSIIIITYHRKKLLEKCLNSIKKFAGDKLSFETIIIFNGDYSYLNEMKKKFPDYKMEYIPLNSPSFARNHAIQKAMGEYFFFLDDDCEIPENYFENINFDQEWDILGGPDCTSPNANFFEKTVGLVLSTPFCMGYTYKRHTTNLTGNVINSGEANLILCNLWGKKNLFQEENYAFPTDLYRNEENYLLKQLKLNDKIILYNPSLYVYHQRKNDLSSLARSVMKSGECRVINFFKLPTYEELIYFSPIVFVGTFLAFCLSLNSALFIIYICYIITSYFYLITKLKTYNFLVLIMQFYVLFFYSLGLIIGIKNKLLMPKNSKLTIRI